MKNEGKVSDDGKFIAVFVLLALVGFILWTTAKPALVYIIYAPDYVQLKTLDLLGMLDQEGKDNLNYVLATYDGRYNPWDVTLDEIFKIQENVGARVQWGMAAVGAAITGLTLFKMKGDGMKRNFSLVGKSKVTVFRFYGIRVDNKFLKFILWWGMTLLCYPLRKKAITQKKEWQNRGASFAHFQAEHWRVALTGAVFNPDKADPIRAQQMTPPEWLRHYKVPLTKETGLDIDAAERAFADQLGPAWSGLAHAKPHVQALLVCFALNVKGDGTAPKLLARLTEIYVTGKEVEKKVTALIAPYLKDKQVVRAIEKRAMEHAYTNTVCYRIAGWGGPIPSWGGKGSVLSPSMFLWLKAVDRTLWYVFQNVGRRKFHIEAAGALSHYWVEKISKHATQKPNMDMALKGLKKYLDLHNITDLEVFFYVEKDFD